MRLRSGVMTTARRTSLRGCVVDVSLDPSHVLVEVDGELDIDNTDEFRDLVLSTLDEARPVLRLDLRRVSFADSSAIQAFVSTQREAAGRGVTTEMVDPHPNVLRLLRLTGTDELFRMVGPPDTPEDPAPTG